MVLFKSAGLTCSRENQVPPFFCSLPAGESKKEKQTPLFVPSLPNLPVCDRYVPSQYLCTVETDCVHLTLFLFVIFAGTGIVNNPFAQFSETGIFFSTF